MQDHRRAIVLGTKSFGKGSVQTVIPLPGHGAMRLTTARYYTPSGRSIQAVGIEPDIKVQPAKIENLAQAERRSEASLRGALNNDTVKKDGSEAKPDKTQRPETPAKPAPGPGVQAPGGTTPSSAAAPGEGAGKPPLAPVKMGDPATDYQLARALDLLRGLSLYKGQMAN